MIKLSNPNQLDIFTPWKFLPPKRRQMLACGWPGLFLHHILASIPVNILIKHISETFGRPAKELYSILVAFIPQQEFDFTDEETVWQYAFNIQGCKK